MPGYPSRALTESPSDRPAESSVSACVHPHQRLTSHHSTSRPRISAFLPPELLRPFLLAFPFFLLPRRRDRPIHTHTKSVRPGLMTSPIPLTLFQPLCLLTHSSGNDKYLATEEVTVQLTEGESNASSDAKHAHAPSNGPFY